MSSYDTSPWPTKDVSFLVPHSRTSTDFDIVLYTDMRPLKVVYTAIVAAMMILAFTEWLMWLGSFLYCLFKAFKKAETWTVKALAVLIGTVFTLLRFEPP